MKNFKMMSLMSAAFVSVLGAEVKKSPELLELERQNRLLKIQIENKKLQMELEGVEISSNENGGAGSAPNRMSGFFLGTEMDLALVGLKQTKPNFEFTYDISVNLGLALGYQHYFDSNQAHAIRTQFMISSGLPSSITDVTLIPVKLGIELGYAWDFLKRGKHTLGLDAGLGYEMHINCISLSAESMAILTHNFYPKFGLHYFYGKHQLQLTYKLGGAIDASTATKESSSRQSIKVETYPSYLNFGYSYRF